MNTKSTREPVKPAWFGMGVPGLATQSNDGPCARDGYLASMAVVRGPVAMS